MKSFFSENKDYCICLIFWWLWWCSWRDLSTSIIWPITVWIVLVCCHLLILAQGVYTWLTAVILREHLFAVFICLKFSGIRWIWWGFSKGFIRIKGWRWFVKVHSGLRKRFFSKICQLSFRKRHKLELFCILIDFWLIRQISCQF